MEKKQTVKSVIDYVKAYAGVELKTNDVKFTRKNNRIWFNATTETPELMYNLRDILTRNLRNSSVVESVAENGYCKLAIFLKK